MSEQRWYWCLRHERPETPGECPNDLRMGPYDTPEAAAAYKERVEARDERWEDDDKAWRGDDEQ